MFLAFVFIKIKLRRSFKALNFS